MTVGAVQALFDHLVQLGSYGLVARAALVCGREPTIAVLAALFVSHADFDRMGPSFLRADWHWLAVALGPDACLAAYSGAWL